jgi:hypothetical protein
VRSHNEPILNVLAREIEAVRSKNEQEGGGD